jgi:arginase
VVIELIAAPSSLGLRPETPGHEPGAWRAPAVLLSAGLASRVGAATLVELDHPRYEFQRQPATGIRNGVTIREYSLTLADAVGAALDASRFPVVVGGDCSVLLGCLVAARRGGRCGLVHLDGHSDFYHPGNYDAGGVLGSVAGMDLALATGRGELLLTRWPHAGSPLVGDDDVIQLGDREADAAGEADEVGAAGASGTQRSWRTIPDTAIVQLTVDQILDLGVETVGRRVVERIEARRLDRIWLHVDLDVLDRGVLPAVDSPGSPGLDFPRLAGLVATLVGSGRIIGVDVTIYDPDRDPEGRYASGIVDCLGRALAPLGACRENACAIPE